MTKYWKRAGHYQHSDRYFTEDFRDTSRIAEEQDSEHIEGSGGCFVAGTLIRTVRGWKPIEKMKIGDGVIAYDRYGNLEAGFVDTVVSVESPISSRCPFTSFSEIGV